eukprot:1374163-Pleurochrysis_carterae.AAC.1
MALVLQASWLLTHRSSDEDQRLETHVQAREAQSSDGQARFPRTHASPISLRPRGDLKRGSGGPSGAVQSARSSALKGNEPSLSQSHPLQSTPPYFLLALSPETPPPLALQLRRRPTPSRSVASPVLPPRVA